MSYFTTIERFFLSLKNSGLALSASDYELIGEWEKRRVPVELICRAIEYSVSKYKNQIRGQRGKISLTKIQTIIEERIQAETYQI